MSLRLTYHSHPQYGIVLDAGSSHTSMFVYKWPADKENDTGIVGQHSSCDVEGEYGLGFLFSLSFAGPNSYSPLLAARWSSLEEAGVQKERLGSLDLGGAVVLDRSPGKQVEASGFNGPRQISLHCR